MSRYYTERKSVLVAGTAVLGAVVAVLESSRFMRVPFPLFPILKFDVVGIPMVLTYLFFGLVPGAATCFVSLVLISFRNPFGGFMKCAAELATIIGAFLILRRRGLAGSYRNKVFAIFSSIVMRVVTMAVANVLLLPVFYPAFYTTQLAIAVIHFICAFNAVQGFIGVLGGFLIYEAVTRRLPSLKP